MQGGLFSGKEKPCFEVNSPVFKGLVEGFAGWLEAMNFEKTSQRDMPGMLTEFLSFMESLGVRRTGDITEGHVRDYLTYLKERPNYKWQGNGGLSQSYIRKQLQVIRKARRYLLQSGKGYPDIFSADIEGIHIKGKSGSVNRVLSIHEIEQLYAATKDDAVGFRDRAMLALYYGCGLRKNEGIWVNASEVMLEKELLYVRKGKGYKERYVPLSQKSKQDLENYLIYARGQLVNIKYASNEALLLSRSGRRCTAPSERLRALCIKAKLRPFGLHTLRHSIATHLLSSGMRLEQIKLFLGHQSLASTQIYTHIVLKGAGRS